jgi:hypothetical protein
MNFVYSLLIVSLITVVIVAIIPEILNEQAQLASAQQTLCDVYKEERFPLGCIPRGNCEVTCECPAHYSLHFFHSMVSDEVGWWCIEDYKYCQVEDGSRPQAPRTMECPILPSEPTPLDNDIPAETLGAPFDWVSSALESNTVNATNSPIYGWNAASFGLPENNVVTADYGEERVYDKNGKFKCAITIAGCTKGPTDTIEKHKGIDFSTRTLNGNPAALPFKSGFSGKVVLVPGSSYNTIGVELPNNYIVQYLHASEILVKSGQYVTPDTILGKSGDTSPDGEDVPIHLHIQVINPKSNKVDPRSIPSIR